MNADEKIALLEQDLRRLKKNLEEREHDLSIYQTEVKRLNLEVSKIMSGLDGDLSLIRKVFKYLVPTQFPHISGFHFSTKFMTGLRFNGDYIDVFEQRDKFKFNLILSSTRGPGLTALLIAFLLKFGRSFGGEDGATNPVDFVAKVLSEIEEKKEKTSDIQLACFLIDKRKYELSYQLHGKICAYFQDGDSSKVREIQPDPSGSLKLKPYDRLVLVSPGLIAATNTKGHLFSSTPILEALAEVPLTQSAHDLRNEIFYRLDQHLDGRKPMQDVSIIIMSVDNNIIKLA